MNSEFQYFKVTMSNDPSVPLLDLDTGCPRYQYKEAPIENPQMMLLRLGDPVPKKPKMADYLSLPSSVFSKKIFDVLRPLEIKGIQLLPARIRGKDDNIFTDYWLLNIYNEIKCIDNRLSDCEIGNSNLSKIKKLVLDKRILETIPLEKRLIFRLAEDWSFQLFHLSIVNAIMAVKPEGIKFINIEEWHDGSNFEN